MNNQYVIFDLDNCISDDQWRIAHIDWYNPNLDHRYARYHALGAFDAPANMNVVREHQSAGHRILVFTARPVLVRYQTEEWLHRQGITPTALIMRNNGDHKPSTDLKRGMLRVLPEYRIYQQDIIAAYDDRADIVAMYAAAGLVARQLFAHTVCAMTPPPDHDKDDPHTNTLLAARQVWHHLEERSA